VAAKKIRRYLLATAEFFMWTTIERFTGINFCVEARFPK
jgi:hypothetical protein